jgi:ribose 5-phosphate isomerase B
VTETLACATLVVRDYDEALEYFTGALGFELIEDEPRGEGKRWVVIRPPGSSGGARLLLARAARPEQERAVGNQTGGRVAFFLYTDDFDRSYEFMRSHGVRFVEEPRSEAYGKVVVFSDLYGNRWDLLEPRKPQSSVKVGSPMHIGVASDHAGFRYKMLVARHLRGLGHEVQDFGAWSEELVDYPGFIRPLANAVAAGTVDRGVVFGGSGNGEAMAANRVRGVRCAVSWDPESARLSRAHNDANVLSIGQRLVAEEQVCPMVDVWLATPFEGGRHVARIRKLDEA